MLDVWNLSDIIITKIHEIIKGELKMSKKILTLRLLEDRFCVCKLNKDETIPEWAYKGQFYSITRTQDELSIVCEQTNTPSGIQCEKDWTILKIEGVLDFSLVGILSAISTILAENKISIFAISTFDTDYILIKYVDVETAVRVLTAENYEIIA